MTKLPQPEGGDRFAFTWGEYPNRPVNSVSTGIWSNGVERSFFTSDSGYLYEAEIGTSFDGDNIYARAELHPNSLGTPANDKSFKKLFIEATSDSSVSISLDFGINYSQKVFNRKNLTISGASSVYGTAVFGTAVYDASKRVRVKTTLKGKGFAITYAFTSSSRFAAPVNISGVITHYNLLGKTP